jgi:hypothetical protein
MARLAMMERRFDLIVQLFKLCLGSQQVKPLEDGTLS